MASGGGQSFLDKFAEVSAKIGNQVHLRSLRDGFATIMPIYILAGIAVLINNVVFPLFLTDDALAAAQYWGNAVTLGTLSFAAILLCGVIGYCLANNKRFGNAIACLVVSICSMVIMFPQTLTTAVANLTYAVSSGDSAVASQTLDASVLGATADTISYTGDVTGMISTTNTGANGLFCAIIIGLVATTVFIAFSNNKHLQINLGEGIPPAVGKSFSVMLPMLITLSIFAVFSALLQGLFGTNLPAIISTAVSAPLMGLMNAGPWAVIVIYTVANLLFCLGIHQSTISGVLAEPILTMVIVENMALYAAGEPIPADHYMNMQIINSFALIGGSGCTLMLLLDTFIFSKHKASRDIAKLSILPGIFNINEPVIYGYPIVYNIPLMIPFVIVPDIFIAATYGLTCLGWISPCVVQAPWTTPPVLSALLSTGMDWRAAVWQVIEIGIGMAIYLPFMKVSEKAQQHQLELEQQANEAAGHAQAA
ncbi:PTS transporter subunit EIIC [Olsenella sp. YH-ols2217]|uniref:Permease IIC component n=1 Tax=Kribbibacterium absianum TaxID=3044210 RepID=A0ABT6ZLJ9_9ACTN|nr:MULTISPECIES: PTS transporter subunit EIIC [unclassified Olsenella]MDJ1121908.1 PTS transporter subunit EIIC [Olsenella sp. YH-ols2216]MDJ1129916.1 PTS transporter subunit EIIC [Olsenella sp. YH-ols2217]